MNVTNGGMSSLFGDHGHCLVNIITLVGCGSTGSSSCLSRNRHIEVLRVDI